MDYIRWGTQRRQTLILDHVQMARTSLSCSHSIASKHEWFHCVASPVSSQGISQVNSLFDDVFTAGPRGDSAGHWRAAPPWGCDRALGLYLPHIVSRSCKCVVADGGIWYYWSRPTISSLPSWGVALHSLWVWTHLDGAHCFVKWSMSVRMDLHFVSFKRVPINFFWEL